jgi:hypothetical protein
MIKKEQLGGFVSVEIARRSKDWACLEKELYKVCKRSVRDAAGSPAHNPLGLNSRGYACKLDIIFLIEA